MRIGILFTLLPYCNGLMQRITVKALYDSPSSIVTTAGKSGQPIGSPWSYSDFTSQLTKHSIDGVSIITNQNQVNGLVQKIAALEINSEKYNSEVVGCYRWGDYPFEVLKNGIGVYQTLDRILNTFTDIHIIFVWEKKNDIIEFTFPNLFLTYSSLSIENGMGHINPGTYEIPLNNLNTLSFPASANNCGTPCTRSFVKYNCPN